MDIPNRIWFIAMGFISYVESCQDNKTIRDREHLVATLIKLLEDFQNEDYNR